jgi:ribosomal protein RSM22 (predicted rRNA methylase)
MRMTIPKSQGKQAYYDARKSDWGDIFPHAPKNAPQERHQPARAKRYAPIKGADIGKRSDLKNNASESYEAVSEDLKAKRRQQRRERQSEDAQTWLD